jgi:hypothetical protein
MVQFLCCTGHRKIKNGSELHDNKQFYTYYVHNFIMNMIFFATVIARNVNLVTFSFIICHFIIGLYFTVVIRHEYEVPTFISVYF